MIPPLVQLPEDLTGTSPANRVVGEPQSVTTAGNRAIVLSYGPYFADSLVIKRASDNTPLSRVEDYKSVQTFVDATIRSGQHVCSVIVINPSVTETEFTIEYQALGGPYSTSVDALLRMIATLQIDYRSVSWGNIVGKPTAFPPAPHLHDVGDVYGWEYVVAELEAIRQAILIGDQASHREIFQYIDHQDGLLSARIDAIGGDISDHLQDHDNPHQVTKAQVGLGNVPNYPGAASIDATTGTSNAHLMTPVRTKEAIDKFAGDLINAHINDHNNPHQTTKAQVGLGNVQNYATATAQEATDGVAPDRYMTPTTTKSAIDYRAVEPLNAHINNLNNPHQTTKGQVGLGNVDNYLTASSAEAVTGTATDRFMTAQRVTENVMAKVGNAYNAHAANQGNPHNVTKAQVGLGAVDNAKQVRNFSANNLELGWDGSNMILYIDGTWFGAVFNSSRPDPNLTNHVNNLNNPHQTNKYHVGLGNVNDFPVANQWEAVDRNNNSRYMTPWSTALMLSTIGGASTGSYVGRGQSTSQVSGTNTTNFTSVIYVSLTSSASNGYGAAIYVGGARICEAHNYNRTNNKSCVIPVQVPPGQGWYAIQENNGQVSTMIYVTEFVPSN